MKKLNLGALGGFPLAINHLQFMEQAPKEVIADLVKGLAVTPTAFKLWGVDLSIVGTTLTVTAGAIWYVNEIIPVDATTITVTAGTTVEDVIASYFYDESITTTTPVTYKDNTVVNSLYFRKAILTTSPSTWLDAPLSIPTLKTLLVPAATTSVSGTVKLADQAGLTDGTSTGVVTADILGAAGVPFNITVDSGGNATILAIRKSLKRSIGNLVFFTIDLDLLAQPSGGVPTDYITLVFSASNVIATETGTMYVAAVNRIAGRARTKVRVRMSTSTKVEILPYDSDVSGDWFATDDRFRLTLSGSYLA